MTAGPERAPIVAPEPRAPVAPLSEPPSFSVVVPAYQAATTIGETLDSVRAQTVPPLEVIVADDGSTDALEAALAAHADAVQLLRLPHRGVAAARNAGMAAARGDFVLYLDADDALLPRAVEALSGLAAARPDLDLLCTDVWFERRGRRAGRFYAANPFPVEGQRAAILESCFVGWPAARRTRLAEVGGFDESQQSAVDWDCWLRLLLDGSSAGLYDEPLRLYRVHDASVTARRAATLWERVRMLERAQRNAGLGPTETRVLARSLGSARVRALAADAEEAIRGGSADRRRRALAVLHAPRAPLGTRLRAAGAALAPGLARTWLRRSSRRSLLERSVPGTRG